VYIEGSLEVAVVVAGHNWHLHSVLAEQLSTHCVSVGIQVIMMKLVTFVNQNNSNDIF